MPAALQHRVLFWGILGALVMRGAMIAAGVALVQQFDWVLYLFGAFLIFAGVKMLFADKANDAAGKQSDSAPRAPEFFPVAQNFDGAEIFRPGATPGSR